MTLSQAQISTLTKAYSAVNAVLREFTNREDENDRPKPIVFELSAAAGCLQTLLTRETQNQINEHQPTQRK